MPVTALKQVVLPAPLGPIRPRISPSSMWKVTSSSAVSPPNLRVSASISRTRRREGTAVVCSSDTGALLSVNALFEGLDLRLDLLGPDRAPGRQQALRTEDGQQHQCSTEDQHAEVREL